MTINVNKVLNIESEIVDLLSASPLMPPTLLVRSFDSDIEANGRVISTDNIVVRMVGIDYVSVNETKDDISQLWNVSFEIMLITRDFRGHHAIFPLIETITFLLSGYRPVLCARAVAPRAAKYTDFNNNSFHYWSLTFDCEIHCHNSWYIDSLEPVPQKVLCMEESCDNLWQGLNNNNEYNICWRRYIKPGENFFRFYNSCSQRPGDEIENIFNDKPYGVDGPKGSLPHLDDRENSIPRGVAINFGLYVNAAGNIGDKDVKGKVGDLNLISGSNVIKQQTSPFRCLGCR